LSSGCHRAERGPQGEIGGATKYSDLAPSPRFWFKAAKESSIGVAEGSIIAAIMTLHIAKTANQLASDQVADLGIISSATGLCMLVAPHNRRSQPRSAAVHMPAAVQEDAWIKSPDGVVKVSSSLGRLSLGRQRGRRIRFARQHRTQSRGR
jgi:hypothetical protein